MTDSDLLKWYTKGFEDELWGKTSSPEGDEIAAYKLGAEYASSGTSITDSMTSSQIVTLIKQRL